MIRDRRATALLLTALVARVGAALTIGNHFHFADEAIYMDAARRLSTGAGLGTGSAGAPAYPVFLSLMSLGMPVSLTFLRVAQAGVAALGVVVVYWLGDRTFGRQTAVWAGLVYALDPLMVITSGLLYPESVAAVTLTVIVLLAVLAAERDRLAPSVSAGALLATLAMLRPVALVLPPIVAAWVACTVAAPLRRRLAHLAALGLAFTLVLSPWISRNLRLHHEVVPMSTPGASTAPAPREEVARQGLLLAVARWAWNNPEALASRVSQQFVQFWELTPSRMVTDNPARREALHRTDPRLEVRPLFSRDLRDLVSAVAFSLELMLTFVGIAVVARARWRQAVLVLALILAYALGYALFMAKLRYRIPILPLLFLFTGAGAAAGYAWMRQLVTGRMLAER